MDVPENNMENRLKLAEDIVGHLDLDNLRDLALSYLIKYTYADQKVFAEEWKDYYED